jgi:hypothetical protein
MVLPAVVSDYHLGVALCQIQYGPGVRRPPDGRDEPMGDVLHMWGPVRETSFVNPRR